MKLPGFYLLLISGFLYIVIGGLLVYAQIVNFLAEEEGLNLVWTVVYSSFSLFMIVVGVLGVLRRNAFTGMKLLTALSLGQGIPMAFFSLLFFNPFALVVFVALPTLYCIGAYKNEN